MADFFDVIKRPVISEKSSLLGEVSNEYVFEVSAKANKQQIHQAVESLFKVKVDRVRTMVMHGKVKRMNRGIFKRSNWKKAIVALKEGQKIEFFQGV